MLIGSIAQVAVNPRAIDRSHTSLKVNIYYHGNTKIEQRTFPLSNLRQNNRRAGHQESMGSVTGRAPGEYGISDGQCTRRVWVYIRGRTSM